jgi:hypothetical protein
MQLAYVAWRASTSTRVVVPARQAENRFLGSLKGLQIRALGIPAMNIYLLVINVQMNYVDIILFHKYMCVKDIEEHQPAKPETCLRIH